MIHYEAIPDVKSKIKDTSRKYHETNKEFALAWNRKQKEKRLNKLNNESV